MRLCRDCKWFGGGQETPSDKAPCRFPMETRIETDYVDGDKTEVYPTCQNMRMSKGVTHYCGCEGRYWEEAG